MLVQEIIRTHIITGELEMPISAALDIMDIHQLRAIPIVNPSGILVGILTEGDVYRCLTSGSFKYTDYIQNIMNSTVVTINLDSTVEEAYSLLNSSGFNRLPVTDPFGRYVGIISRIDVLQALLAEDESEK